MTWRKASLEKVCTVVTDGTHYTPPDVGAGIPFLTVKDMTSDGLDFTGCARITDGEFQRAVDGNSAPRPGDVLFSKDGTVGKVHVVDQELPFAVLSSIAILRPRRTILDSGYFGYVLRTPQVKQQASRKKTGSALRRIILKDLRAVRFPLPPLPEQRRIAAILDKADAIRRKRRESIKLLEEFLRSAFLEMFGDPVRNEKGWKMCDVGSAVTEITAGWSAKSEDREPDDAEWGVLKISSVTSGRFLPSECKVVGNDIGRSVVTPSHGDLLFSRANTRELVAATCLVERDTPRRFLPDKLWKITPAVPVRAEYLRYLFGHPGFRARICRQATGTSGSMLNISQKKLRRMQMPNAPSILQDRFARLVWSTYKARRQMEVATEGFDQLFNSLAQRAFRGKL